MRVDAAGLVGFRAANDYATGTSFDNVEIEIGIGLFVRGFAAIALDRSWRRR